MSLILFLLGLVLSLVALYDGFETMVLPRRVTRVIRPARLYYRTVWSGWKTLSTFFPAGKRRNSFLSVFGPLSLIGLFIGWVGSLIIGFALIQRAISPELVGGDRLHSFVDYLYLSGETFFTLGYGDVTPAYSLGRACSVLEAGTGFGFMAVIIGYLPVLYQAFSARERTIALLDARAGSPPTVSEGLIRLARNDQISALDQHLPEWERWAADLLESHLSFPVLSYYRSQHDNQSWLAALAVVLDTSSVLLVIGERRARYVAQMTYAMGRHAAVDLSLVFGLPPKQPARERVTDAELKQLLDQIAPKSTPEECAAMRERLTELRSFYEPFLMSLSEYFALTVPRFVPDKVTVDNWQTSAWTHRAPGIGQLPGPEAPAGAEDQHFE
jgi:hypothetical protein